LRALVIASKLAPTKDKLYLHKIDVDALLGKAPHDYLLVLSRPTDEVYRGRTFRYAPVVKSKKGGVKIKLDSGPEGMQVTADGQVVVFPLPVGRPLAEHHQYLRHVRHLSLGACLHQPPGRLHQQRPLLPVAHLHRLPCPLRQGGTPPVHAPERCLGLPPAALGGRQRRGQVAHRGVGRHRQQVALTPLPQLTAEPAGPAHLIVPEALSAERLIHSIAFANWSLGI